MAEMLKQFGAFGLPGLVIAFLLYYIFWTAKSAARREELLLGIVSNNNIITSKLTSAVEAATNAIQGMSRDIGKCSK